LTQTVLPLSESNLAEVNRAFIAEQRQGKTFDDILHLLSFYFI
jgi:hypothetical protein